MFATAARRFPITLFPVLLGLTGMGLALRRAVPLGVPPALADLWLGMAAALVLVASGFYLAKLALDPGAIFRDLAPAPARGAASAGAMALMLAGAGMAPVMPGAATALWVFGALAHWAVMGVVMNMMKRETAPQPVWVPGLYLVFVGQIVAPYGGVALGFSGLSTLLFLSALVGWALLLVRLIPATRAIPAGAPAPLRPGQAIHLAPFMVGAGAAWALGTDWADALALVLTALGLPVAAVLLSRARWLTEGGWSPAWGAFTFPAAAAAGALTAAAKALGGGAFVSAVAFAALALALAVVLRVAAGAVVALRAGKLAPPV